jgi:signal transduction histidine kinase
LVDNAVRYNRTDGRVRLHLTPDNGRAIFAISNTGPGIPAERQASLFKRFSRIDQDRNRQTGGSGLGLSLCREIAAAHCGNIAIESSGEDATMFLVSLPIAGP